MRRTLLATLWICSTVASLEAQPLRLADLFTDSMVLQREKPIAVWGDAPAGCAVTVKLAGTEAKATADAQGQWKAVLPAQPAGGPHELTAQTTETVRLGDVLIGDVWVCSGQSNMQWEVRESLNADQEIASADYPEIRLFSVERSIEFTPQRNLARSTFGFPLVWKRCTPASVGDFSAVGYFFGRAVHRATKVPIGLIDSSWGGTAAQVWISEASARRFPEMAAALDTPDGRPRDAGAMRREYQARLQEWHQAVSILDDGLKAPGWMTQPGLASEWTPIPVPGDVDKGGEAFAKHDGVIWYRREVTLPEDWAGRDLILSLGEIDDEDVTWFNGEKVGGFEAYFYRRTYRLPARLVNAGPNVITVRVVDYGGAAGFRSPENSLWIGPAAEAKGESVTTTMSLAGKWPARKSVELSKAPKRPDNPLQHPNVPCALYNSMIAPLTPAAIRGVIWYQGEANAPEAWKYRTVFPALIRDWRQQWGGDEFPFLFVQLANFRIQKYNGTDDEWAELRAAQFETLQVPKTGMAVAIDIGESEDIHPRNKQAVGERLALAARKITYGEDLVYSGPIYTSGSLKLDGSKARVEFQHAAGGLKVPEGKTLQGFTIAGADQKFHPAQATIEGSSVIVQSPDVQSPVAVRYGWAADPVCTLYNTSDLPAIPFRTDDWEWKTARSVER